MQVSSAGPINRKRGRLTDYSPNILPNSAVRSASTFFKWTAD